MVRLSAPITARPLQKSFLHPCLALCWVLIKFIAIISRDRVRVSVRILGLRKPKVKVKIKAKFRWYIQWTLTYLAFSYPEYLAIRINCELRWVATRSTYY